MLIKICGLKRKEDIEYVNRLKPDLVGFVFARSKRQISIDTAIKLKSMLNKDIKIVGVFRNNNINLIRKIVKLDIINYIQLHGNENDEYILKIKNFCNLPIIKAYQDSKYADYILYDNLEPGSGKECNWKIINNKQFFLAGGININNINKAIKLNPYCIDISSGVEADENKDFNKMKELIDKIRKEIMMRTIEDFAMMEPMRYYDNAEPKTASAIQKRQNMIDNKDNKYIATEKHDGDWGMFIHYSKGNNLIRSRSISVKTGQYGDLTEKLPHLAAEMDEWPDNSVVLAEICWEQYGTNANTVGTILRCLPPKAVERQKENKLYGLVFDILMWDNKDLTSIPYFDRTNIFCTEFNSERGYNAHYFKPTDIFFDNFAEEADRIISAGGEGLVIQLKNNQYAPGTRTAWNTLKMKQSLPHMDLKVVSTIEPNKLYDGDLPETWKFTIDGVAVTKPYYMGWKNGVNVDFNGVTVSVTSGLTDEDREWLATEAAQEMIKNGELFAEVKAMSINSQNSLRHPSLVRLRNDVVKD